jgi:hypothetical protein
LSDNVTPPPMDDNYSKLKDLEIEKKIHGSEMLREGHEETSVRKRE